MAVSVLLGLFAGLREASAAPEVQLYVKGRQYGSVAEYQQDKKTDMVLAPAIVPVVGAGKASVEFPDGKTLTLSPDGKMTQEKGVTVLQETTVTPAISPADTLAGKGEARLAGVTPSLADAVASFRSGDGRQVPIAVYSAADLDEQLRRRLRDSGRPVLLISDKKKVRVMELQEAPSSSSGQ